MIRYDKGRIGLKGRTLSLKQWAEWVVTHPILQTMAQLMENMFVENINVILCNHSTSANSTDLMETTEAPNNFQKQRGGNEKAENWYCETDSHANPLTLPQDSPLQSSIPGLGGLKETKMFPLHPRVKVSIVGSLRDREVAC